MKEGFKIIFSDDYLVVIDKIAKVLVQPSPKREKITLTYLLQERIGKKIFPCHRLDRETTGLIIYAKTSQIQRKIMEEFKQREVRKAYFAFVKGNLKKKKGVLEGRIIDKEGSRFGEKSKPAKTLYKVQKEFKDFSLVKLEPLTGRTNQLRIQLAKVGHPILGERKYAFGRDFKVKFKRLALHSCFLSFIHPISRERLTLSIDLASDMQKFLKDKDKKPLSSKV